jgi:hypothetical protein
MRAVGTIALLSVVAAPLLALGVQAPDAQSDNEEILRIHEADQADRRSPGEIDWVKVSERDAARLKRIKELYQSDEIRTGKDWFRSALVLQHSQVPEDHLLAHEMCIAALALGERSAAWLAAATEDRFLRGIGRGQRFGTQYATDDISKPMTLVEVEEGVTDGLRSVLNVPPLPEPGAEFKPHR